MKMHREELRITDKEMIRVILDRCQVETIALR